MLIHPLANCVRTVMQIFNFNRNGTNPKTTHAEWIAIPHHIHMFECKFHRQTKAFRQFSQALTLSFSLSLCCVGWHFWDCVVQAIFHPRNQSSFAVEPTCTPSATNVCRAARWFGCVWVCVKVCLCKCLQPVFTTLIWSPFSTPNKHRNLFDNLFDHLKGRAKVRVLVWQKTTWKSHKQTVPSGVVNCWVWHRLESVPEHSLDICLYVYAGIPIHTLHAHTHTYKPPPPGICRFSSALLCVFSRLIDILRNISFYQLDR